MSVLILPEILESEWALSIEMIKDFKMSSYYLQLRHACSDLDISLLYKSALHGLGHIERVLLLGALIAWKEGLSDLDTNLLLLACSYHDVGREHDYRDEKHGLRSAEMIHNWNLPAYSALPEKEQKILLAMVEAHSLNDSLMLKVGTSRLIEGKSMPRYFELAADLKDADNLDRVRLRDLDITHLRHRSSINLAPFAESLYLKYLGAEQI